jgi:hypothetical protein
MIAAFGASSVTLFGVEGKTTKMSNSTWRIPAARKRKNRMLFSRY